MNSLAGTEINIGITLAFLPRFSSSSPPGRCCWMLDAAVLVFPRLRRRSESNYTLVKARERVRDRETQRPKEFSSDFSSPLTKLMRFFLLLDGFLHWECAVFPQDGLGGWFGVNVIKLIKLTAECGFFFYSL